MNKNLENKFNHETKCCTVFSICQIFFTVYGDRRTKSLTVFPLDEMQIRTVEREEVAGTITVPPICLLSIGTVLALVQWRSVVINILPRARVSNSQIISIHPILLYKYYGGIYRQCCSVFRQFHMSPCFHTIALQCSVWYNQVANYIYTESVLQIIKYRLDQPTPVRFGQKMLLGRLSLLQQ